MIQNRMFSLYKIKLCIKGKSVDEARLPFNSFVPQLNLCSKKEN